MPHEECGSAQGIMWPDPRQDVVLSKAECGPAQGRVFPAYRQDAHAAVSLLSVFGVCLLTPPAPARKTLPGPC
jgi:hypothetical protein